MKENRVIITYKNQKPIQGRILDISFHGIGIATAKPIANSSIVFITIKTKKEFQLRGKIKNSAKLQNTKTYPYRTGIRLLSLTKKQKDLMNEFIISNTLDIRNS